MLDTSLAHLVRDGVVTREEALLHAEDAKLLSGAASPPPPAGAPAPAAGRGA